MLDRIVLTLDPQPFDAMLSGRFSASAEGLLTQPHDPPAGLSTAVEMLARKNDK